MQNVLMGSLGIPDAVLARARRVAHDIGRSAAALGGSVAPTPTRSSPGGRDCSGSHPPGGSRRAAPHGCWPPETAGAR